MTNESWKRVSHEFLRSMAKRATAHFLFFVFSRPLFVRLIHSLPPFTFQRSSELEFPEHIMSSTTMFSPYSSSSSSSSSQEETETDLQKDQNWCQTVRDSCRRYYDEQADDEKLVTISSLKLQEMAHDIAQTRSDNQQNELVTWDEEEWHYNPPKHWSAHVRNERIALYILALDAVNFCFWPSQTDKEEKHRYEYSDLATNLTRAAEEDHAQQDLLEPNQVSTSTYALSATQLASMNIDRVQQILCGNGKSIPLLEERCQLWNEVGHVLLEHFQGSAWNLIQQANGSPVQAVNLLVAFFPGFRDYQASCAFLKRAQICVGDWQAALDLEEWKSDMKALTTFADYRLPQLLRERGVMEYHPALAERVDALEEIKSNTPAEWAIRAATVVVVDELVQCLNNNSLNTPNSDKEWTAVSVDWYLWQLGEQLNEKGELKPHHRVLTTFY